MLLSECVVLDSKISRFIKEKEASDLLSNLGLKRPFSRNPLLSDIKFQRYKINETKKHFFKTAYNVDLHLVFVGHLLKSKRKTQKIQRERRFKIYLSDKTCFLHDTVYRDFQELSRGTADLLQWFIKFLIKMVLVVMLHAQINLLLNMTL